MPNTFIRLKGDPVIWGIIFALCAVSLVEVFSATSMLSYGNSSYWQPFIRQGALLAVGLGICIGMHYVPCHLYRYISAGWPFIIILLFIMAFTGGDVNGAARWAKIGELTFQPSELAKGILVATVALVLSQCREGNGVNKQAWKYVAFFSLPIIILIFKENISTAVFLCGVVFVMMFVAGVPTRQMLTISAVGIALVVIGIASLKAFPSRVDDPFYKTSVGSVFKRVPTAKERIFGNSLVITENPDSLALTDKNMQVVHARIAVANNNHGLGLLPGNSVERDYLPQAYSDFIYAIIAEETGIWGASIVLLLYLVLLYRIGIIANNCGRDFAAFLVMGLGVLLVGQALLNMFVAVGLGPVTGQTLPLISRGGTSTFITSAYFGILQSVAWSGVRKKTEPAPAPQTPQPQHEVKAAETEKPQPAAPKKDKPCEEEEAQDLSEVEVLPTEESVEDTP